MIKEKKKKRREERKRRDRYIDSIPPRPQVGIGRSSWVLLKVLVNAGGK